jgi:hypothetical protein
MAVQVPVFPLINIDLPILTLIHGCDSIADFEQSRLQYYEM